jgi:hypothetical protein
MAEVRFLGCDNDVFCSNVAARAAEFERISGHRVTVQLLGNDVSLPAALSLALPAAL